MNNFVINSKKGFIADSLKNIDVDLYKKHQLEQIIFRMYICESCLLNKKCKNCRCNVYDKLIEPISCNPRMFPNMVKEKQWEAYKKTNNIHIL